MKYYDEELRQWEYISYEDIKNEWMLHTAMHPCFAYELYDHIRYYVNILKLADKKVGDILDNKDCVLSNSSFNTSNDTSGDNLHISSVISFVTEEFFLFPFIWLSISAQPPVFLSSFSIFL